MESVEPIQRPSQDQRRPDQDRRVSIDVPPSDVESGFNNSTPVPVRRSRTGRLIATDVRAMIAELYQSELKSMLKWRDFWKKFGDSCEAVAKVLTGVGAVLAFASSAIQDSRTADILSFSSGTVGTMGLVMLTYSGYAIRESKQRTSEVNGILTSIGVTPLPDIAEEDDALEAHRAADSQRRS